MSLFFSISNYCDNVLCDVVPIKTSYLLLGRPQQYDRRDMHDRVTNKYLFEMNWRSITLVFLVPKEIYEEQLKLKEKMVEKKAYILGDLIF